MKRAFASAVVMLVIAMTLGSCGHMQREGWTTLIDGDKGMDNWYVTGSAGNWRAEGGAIQADKTAGKGASVLTSKKTFKDHEVYVEFWAADETNSGVYVRAPDPKTINTASGAYEVQIWDRNPNPRQHGEPRQRRLGATDLQGRRRGHLRICQGNEITVKRTASSPPLSNAKTKKDGSRGSVQRRAAS